MRNQYATLNDDFTKDDLVGICVKAERQAERVSNPNWGRALTDLSQAANVIHAMVSRSENNPEPIAVSSEG